MNKIVMAMVAGMLFLTMPAFAQLNNKKSQESALSDSRIGGSSAFGLDNGDGKTIKKSKRKKSAASLKRKANRRKGKSDCDCPGSKKGKRLIKRSRRH